MSDAASTPSLPWWRRGHRGELLIAALCALLGFALVTQVRTSGSYESLATAREGELVQILDDLTSRTERLRREVTALERTRDELQSGTDTTGAALDEARRRFQVLGILAGTAPATGPGVVLRIEDPDGQVRSDVLVDALQELRDAGAEALQVNDVRLVASSHFLDSDGGGIFVDGQELVAPYEFLVVGDADTMVAAMEIPGGVIDTVALQPGASAVVEARESVTVRALREPETPRYARPASESDD